MQSIPWLKGKFHIPDALWRKYDYLDLYPLDGGASFIVDEFVGTRKDREITGKVVSGKLLERWGELPELDWKRHGEVRNLELYCWLHRWYFVPSMAHICYLERDEKLAELIFNMLSSWVKTMGCPRTKEEMLAVQEEAVAWDRKFQKSELPSRDVRVPWEWYDFQPAYRLLVLVVSAHLLRESKAMQKHQAEMRDWIAAHANSILWVTQKYGYLYGNHHTLRMMCMFLAGQYVEHENAAEWRSMALEMQTRHIGEDFFEDGMYKESLPGYTPFVVTHFREVLLAATANGQNVPEVFEKSILRSLSLLKAMVMPDGFLPVINDGPRVNIAGVIDLMEHYYPSGKDAVKPFSANLASGFPIFHDDRNYLIFDANYAQGSHVQAGKLGLILWRGKEPFIIEGGCCNYDNPDFQPYFRRGWAHSTLLVDDQEDAVWKSFWVWTERAHPVIKDSSEGKKPFVEAESDGFKRMGIIWSRRIEHPIQDSFVITDSVVNLPRAAHAFGFRFIIAQEDVKVDVKRNEVVIKGKDSMLTIKATLVSHIQMKRVKSNFFGDMRDVACIDFMLNSAEDFKQTFALTFK